MPFTISHAAAVLPFARPLARWRLLSATVIGSMVPDFGFLMLWRPARVDTHSAVGLVTFCLPVGLSTFWVFQQLLKGPIMAVLPNATYARWRNSEPPADIGSLKQWVYASCAVLIGAVTHLVWDGFTHEGARGVRMLPVLDDPIVDIAGHHLVGARLLQDLSSLAGLIIVLAIVGYGLRRGRRGDPIPRRYLESRERHAWIAAYAVTAVLLAALSLVIRRPTIVYGHTLAVMIGRCAIASLRGFAASLLIVSLCLRIRLRAKP
jgi:hypothetical protein